MANLYGCLVMLNILSRVKKGTDSISLIAGILALAPVATKHLTKLSSWSLMATVARDVNFARPR